MKTINSPLFFLLIILSLISFGCEEEDDGGIPTPEAACGNSSVEAGETCDDGNTEDGDGCSATCKIEVIAAVCGDGIMGDGETCDDGNTEDGDGCSATCQDESIVVVDAVCGNGTVEEGETCDDGNTEDGDNCPADCQASTELPGECTNDADLAYLASTVGDGTGRDAASAAAKKCGLSSLSKPDPGVATIACMLDEEGIGLTQGCATCYGGIILCVFDNCITLCVTDSTDPACIQCQVDNGCISTFTECTGPLPE